MADKNHDDNPGKQNMLSIEQLKLYPGFENKSDEELKELAEFLKEFSLILYEAVVKSQNIAKSNL